MILKAGTYRFNDVPSPFVSEYGLSTTFDFSLLTVLGTQIEFNTMILYGDGTEVGIAIVLGNNGSSDDTLYNPNTGWNTDIYPVPPVCTILKDSDVDDTFGSWFISTTDYAEVNKPLAEITYNGETIAQLNAGETATLSCKDKKMASDVVVKVNEVESKIPEGYVKPEGTLNILRNNTTYDVSQYAEVRIATAHPYEVPLEMLMNNVISDASQATIGNVYKYTGETTDTYEQGALYILEEVSE